MRCAVIIFFLFSCGWLFAQPPQQYRFVNFGAKDGLTDKYVYDAVQDEQGYMWFGTTTGLYQYDGHRFQKVRSTIDRPGRAISNTLQAIAKDTAGHLWLGSINTLQWLDPQTHKFWAPDEKNTTVAQMMNSLIQRIVLSKNGTMWIGTNKNYFFRFNPADSSFTHFNTYPAAATNAVVNIIEANNEIYAVHAEGLYKFDQSGKFTASFILPFNKITNAFFDEKTHNILLTTDQKGILQFHTGSKQFIGFFSDEKLKSQILFAANKTADGGYLLGGYPLHYIHPEKKQFYSFEQNKEDYRLHSTKIVSIVKDREQNIWLCSHSGLSMIPFQNAQIETIPLEDPSTNLPVEPVQVYPSPVANELLITNTTSKGLIVYNILQKKFYTIPNPLNTERKRIYGLITAPDSSIYLSDRLHLFQYMPAQKKMKEVFLKDQNGNPLLNITRSVFDKDGIIYVTSLNNGFYVWNYREMKVTHILKADIDKENREDNNVSPCLVDSKNNCWFTSGNGVYRFNKKENRYIHIKGAGSKQVPFMGVTFDAAEDSMGHIWIVTQSSGVYEWYEENGKEQLVNYNSGTSPWLPADFCWRIVKSPVDSCLWISNVFGLLRFDPVQKRVLSVMAKQNGLSEDDGGYNFNIAHNRYVAQLYYGALHLIDLDSYRFNGYKPAVMIRSLKVMDKELLPLVHQNEIVLNADENFLQFEVAALLFNNGNRNQYAWMLKGVDTNWVYGGNNNKVNYSSLKPGTYVFRIKAANNDGLWGDVTEMKIRIRPPFYAAWWFISSCVLAGILLLYFINRYRVLQARKEERLKADFQQQIAETEMKALRAQMNPHFIFNSLNSIQKYILKNEHFEASQYLTKFSRLIRLILDQSNQNNILLSNELDHLKLYMEMENLRFGNKFESELYVDPALNTETCEIPSMLIQPYVENAIWHGLLHKDQKGKLTIRFLKQQNNRLCVVIEDNGIGREKAAQLKSKQILKKKSYGMQITENRIAVINRLQNIDTSCTIEDLKNDQGTASGTRVTLNIPLKSLNT